MALQTEKLQKETLDFIKNSQTEISEYVFQMGELTFKKREITTQLNKLDEIQKELEEKFDLTALKLENAVQDILRKYPNGDINLEEGTITYES